MDKPPVHELRRIKWTGYVTPSNIDSWLVTRAEGDKFSEKQLYWMRAWGIDPEAVEVVEVRRTLSINELWRPFTHGPYVLLLECPVLGPVRADGRVQVLSPAGHKKLVYTDGAITRRKPWRQPA